MPIIGSLDGTFGHGRSPQTQPAPGFTFFPRIGNRSTWTFTANGAFSFSGNDTYSVSTNVVTPPVGAGNVYVIVPNTTFLANVKLWAAGGGSGGNASVTRAVNIQGGGAGAVTGQVLFQSGQEYTVVASGGAFNNTDRSTNRRGGGGGGVSGIFKGNAFVDSLTTLEPVVLAGGGGGAGGWNGDGPTGGGDTIGGEQWRFPGAGGGNLVSQIGEKSLLLYGSFSTSFYSTNSVGQSVNTPKGSIGQVFSGTDLYAGGQPQVSARDGGGGGGYQGGPLESGGMGYVSSDQELVRSIPGLISLPALYDDSDRDTAGDPGHPGKVIIYTDEHRLANIVATGGTVTDVPIPDSEFSYRYHTFTSNGRFTITSTTPNSVIDIFAVGGGGGSAGRSGAGGGSVTIRTNFPVPVTANYIVTVGAGGAASDSYAADGIGRIFGGYKGGDSAFFNNNLSTKAFPDNYIRLINSFGKQVRYITQSGDDSTGLTQATGYTTIESALNKNAYNPDMIVFVVIQGTYDVQIPASDVQTPINDKGLPRVFICAPGKVTINFTPAQSTSQRDAPMAVLENPYSAIYGATIVRNMFDTTDLTETAFFNNRADPGDRQTRGSFYNCVFRENTGKWAFIYGPTTRDTVRMKFENCTFFTRDANQNLTSTNGSSESKVLLLNCVFNKIVTTDAVQVNCATNIAVGAKYVVTGVSDKGVYAGEYGWGAAVTAPERNAPLIAMVARGGGGAPYNISDGPTNASQEYMGGTGPGNNYAGNKITYIQPEHQANVIYSSYGYPGGRSAASLFAGGGGAGGPGMDAAIGNSFGGIGIEWPYDSNNYYGSGGSAASAADISLLVPGTIGKGGGGNTPTAGNPGTVIVRYVVAGSYTPPAAPPLRNLIAHGGLITSTNAYIEHKFETSGTFYIVRPSNIPNFYIDMIIIGGGGGGSGNNHDDDTTTGRPGEVRYVRIPLTADQQSANSLGVVKVGVGGGAGYNHYEDAYGRAGTATTFSLGPISLTASPGGAVIYGGWPPQAPSVLITDGLFSDNTTSYGGSGGKYSNRLAPVPGWGSYGSGGFGATPGGWHDAGGAGYAGAVIIRYPILPT